VASGNGELVEAAVRLAAELSRPSQLPVGLTGGEAVVCTALASPVSRLRGMV